MTDYIRELPFETAEFTLSADNMSFTFLQPSDADAVLDSVPESAYTKDRFLPYWAENWPSAAPFFSLLHRQNIRPASTVLDLGTGLGILATALSAKGVFIVGLDISPDSCQFAAFNMRRNNEVARVVCADWRAFPFNCRFDLIVASDILYEERWIPVILDALDLLLQSNGCAWIADPCRRFWVPFKNAATARQYSIRTLHHEPASSSGKIEIIELRKMT